MQIAVIVEIKVSFKGEIFVSNKNLFFTKKPPFTSKNKHTSFLLYQIYGKNVVDLNKFKMHFPVKVYRCVNQLILTGYRDG